MNLKDDCLFVPKNFHGNGGASLELRQTLHVLIDVIDRLAAEITKDRYSDLEKALAIEQYFSDAGYVYDLAYQKAEGENIVDFLTVSHTGVCYEYATAMTLLCRSAGLPTRYVQGFNLGERYEKGLSIQNSRGNQNIKATLIFNCEQLPFLFVYQRSA